jgi:peptidyl-dipeptidase Dcp
MCLTSRPVRLLAAAMLLNCGAMLADAAPSAPTLPPTVTPATEPDVFPGNNPLAAVSTLPFEAPPFDKLKDSDYQPAIEAGMVQETADYDAIANDKAAPNFENTITAMEKAGQLLSRATNLFQNLLQANSSDILQKVNQDEAPRLQAHSDAILLNSKLFARVKAVYEAREHSGLNADQKFLALRIYRKFVHAGAELSEADKAKLTAINGQIAALQAQYQDKLLAAGDAGAVVVSDKAELDGLTDGEIAVLAEAAKARRLDGKYVIALRNTTQQPILASLTNRAVRQATRPDRPICATSSRPSPSCGRKRQACSASPITPRM